MAMDQVTLYITNSKNDKKSRFLGQPPPPPYPVTPQQAGSQQQGPIGVFNQGARFDSGSKPTIPVCFLRMCTTS